MSPSIVDENGMGKNQSAFINSIEENNFVFTHEE
jgi:hypothetical protein